MWEIAAPCSLAVVAQFSIGLVTVVFVGHLGSLELADVFVVQNAIEAIGSALETLCGQAIGVEPFLCIRIATTKASPSE
nr:protein DETOXIFICATION 33-like isoform X2 [Ipomoea trifida]